MPEYLTLGASSSNRLDALVNDFIHQGFRPLGGVAVATDGKCVLYAQAMLKVGGGN